MSSPVEANSKLGGKKSYALNETVESVQTFFLQTWKGSIFLVKLFFLKFTCIFHPHHSPAQYQTNVLAKKVQIVTTIVTQNLAWELFSFSFQLIIIHIHSFRHSMPRPYTSLSLMSFSPMKKWQQMETNLSFSWNVLFQ